MTGPIRLCVVTSSLYAGVIDFIRAQSFQYETHVIFINYPHVPVHGNIFDSIYSYPVSYKAKSVFLAEVGVIETLTIIPSLFGMYKQIRSVLKNHKIDIVHAQWAIPCGFLVSIASHDVPFVTTIRGLDAKVQSKQFMFQPFVKYALKKSSHVVALSGKLKKEAMELGVASQKISLIPCGIDQTKFVPINRASARTDLNLKQEIFTILYVGNLIKLKGVDKIIRICGRLKKECNVLLVILGDGPERQNLMNLAKNLNLNDNIIFKGRVSYQEMPVYMCAANVLLLLSDSEGLPTCVQEAMSCGIPVIASNVGGLPDIIIHGENGFLSSDEDEALNYLQQLISSPELAVNMGRGAFTYAKENLSLEKVVQRTDEIYRSLLK